MPVKIVLSLAIIGYLVYKAADTPEKRAAFADMLQQHKDWGMLAAGFIALFVAVLITMVRWWYLVRAVGIDFSLPDALRISFLGYMVNFAPTGIAGGDLLKAWMLAKEHPGNSAKSLASVVVDRIVGLYVLFLVASAGVFATGFWNDPDPVVHWLCRAVLIVTAISTVGITLILIPGFLEGRFVQAFTRLPKVGRPIGGLIDAMIIYRARRMVLFWSSVATLPVHTLLTLSIFFVASGMRFDKVSCRDYFAIYPVSGIAQTIPLPAGPAESGIVFFYKTAWLKGNPAEDAQKTAQQQGLILALVYRLSTLLIVPIGVAYYYLGARGEVAEIIHEHEEEQEPQSGHSPG
jgi:uncharacterized protein (TIRG00374 family)